MIEKLTHKLMWHCWADKVKITNDSEKHRHHKGNFEPTGNSHFTVIIISDCFEGMPLVKRHKKVYEILDEEIKGGIHALAITAKTPGEINGK